MLLRTLSYGAYTIQAQGEAHWKDIAQVKDQASAKEKHLLSKIGHLEEQLRVIESEVMFVSFKGACFTFAVGE